MDQAKAEMGGAEKKMDGAEKKMSDAEKKMGDAKAEMVDAEEKIEQLKNELLLVPATEEVLVHSIKRKMSNAIGANAWAEQVYKRAEQEYKRAEQEYNRASSQADTLNKRICGMLYNIRILFTFSPILFIWSYVHSLNGVDTSG